MFVSLASTSFYMPADGVFAAYKPDFGTSHCASRGKDYNSFRRTQKRNVCFWHKADIREHLTNVCFWG
jgi:hypothetical protein